MKSVASLELTLPVPKHPGSTFGGIVRQTLRRAREGQLPVTRQVAEMVILKLVYGLGPGHYHTARYWRKDLSWDFKTGFWPYRKFRRVVSRLNPPSYQKLSQNKVCEKALLQLLHIPTPRFIGSLHVQRGLSASGTRLTGADDLHALLLMNPGLDRLCFKLVEGYGGEGFRAVETLRGDSLQLRLLDTGQLLSVPEFVAGELALSAGSSYIIEEYVQQHPALARLNRSSVNTLRIWATCCNDESAVIDAFLRVGGRGSLVDNTSRGAQSFRIDVRTGLIGEGMVKNIDNETFQNHRDSGERISGGTLPFWDEALSLARRAVTAFPHISFAGVDIAITEQGPVVIELNVEPDPTSAIIFDRSHRELLAVFKSVLPDEYPNRRSG
jgi:hypothetical protein